MHIHWQIVCSQWHLLISFLSLAHANIRTAISINYNCTVDRPIEFERPRNKENDVSVYLFVSLYVESVVFPLVFFFLFCPMNAKQYTSIFEFINAHFSVYLCVCMTSVSMCLQYVLQYFLWWTFATTADKQLWYTLKDTNEMHFWIHSGSRTWDSFFKKKKWKTFYILQG